LKMLETLERELMLMARYQVLAWRARDECLERSAYMLLSRLELDGPMSIRQLAEAFGLDTSTVNRQTAALLRAELVERIPDTEGGLARKLRIAAAGAAHLAADREYFQNRLGRVIADWAPREVDELTTVITRFNRSIEKLEGRPWPRPR
jgi:DNA-binding MarR family transcriptional regulator